MHITAIHRETSIDQSLPVDQEHYGLTRHLDPARGVMVASAVGAFMWGALAGIVWFLV